MNYTITAIETKQAQSITIGTRVFAYIVGNERKFGTVMGFRPTINGELFVRVLWENSDEHWIESTKVWVNA